MMCMTELHGGVCHRTSTPHKSGNKMKEKKKKETRRVRGDQIEVVKITHWIEGLDNGMVCFNIRQTTGH